MNLFFLRTPLLDRTLFLFFSAIYASMLYQPAKSVSFSDSASAGFAISLPDIYCCALAQEIAATRRPNKRPSRSASSKWTPPYLRDIPDSSAASVNVSQLSTTSWLGPGLPSNPDTPAGRVYENPNSSLRVNRFRTSAADALIAL